MSTLRIKKRRRTHYGPILLIAVGLLLIALMIWQLSGRASTISSLNAAPAVSEIARVDLQLARAAAQSGEAVIIDVRDEASFASGHIPGAVNIPLNQIESQLANLDSDQWYIPYCT
jgi:3-mercaptopyruvate sulfurtransferase SseA